jgi:cytoskeletal protein CcmA (bactofilin family)
MGRNPKAEVNENEKQQQPAPQYPAYNAPAQPAAAAPSQTYAEPPARTEFETPSTARAVTETESLAREIKDGTMSGFVGGGTILSGEAEFKGMLRIDGHLTGRITSEKGTLIISSGGRVDANINVATAKINGTVNGDIVASERLEFGRTAQVYGNIQTPVLIIEQGAIFEGGCRMQAGKAAQDKQATDKPRAKEFDGRAKEPEARSAATQPIQGKSGAPEMLTSSNVTR